jgi:hypothetical protein
MDAIDAAHVALIPSLGFRDFARDHTNPDGGSPTKLRVSGAAAPPWVMRGKTSHANPGRGFTNTSRANVLLTFDFLFCCKDFFCHG